MGWEDEHGRPATAAGKRIRPALCLFAAETLCGSAEAAMPGAVAIELVHNFSLVHDEIQDQDAERHHRPTLWARLGDAQSINAGDLLYTFAVRALTNSPGDPDRRLQALAVLHSAIAKMIHGQWLDIDFESRDTVSIDDYLDMVAGKTGALLAAPLEIGAILGGADRPTAAALGRWGALVGAAFQAQDDYLGTWGNPDITGKSNSNDIARRKKTLPIVFGLSNADAAAIIRRTYSGQEVTPFSVSEVVAALEDAGAHDFCRERAREQTRAADALLATLPLSPEQRASFRTIAAYLVDRDA